jgi:hypothetical protein
LSDSSDTLSKYEVKKTHRKISPITLLMALNFGLICFLLLRSGSLRHCSITSGEKPVIEFYLHGRGSGHWTGSWGLMEVLIEKGYDLRVYATNPMPAVARDDDPEILLKIINGEPIQQEKMVASSPFVNYTIVDDIMPDMSIWQITLVILKRVPRWSGISRPLMIITDGDVPSAWSSYFYGIPSLYMTHGQMFTANPPPPSLPKKYLPSWQKQATLNGRGSGLTTYAIGFNHVPFLDSVARPWLRKVVLEMAKQRAARIAAYQGSSKKSPRPLLVTYFRDENGGPAIEMLLKEEVDVVVFGFVPKIRDSSLPGKIIPISDATLFVQFMGIADGIVSSSGCILQAECVYAEIPMLVLYKEGDSEHELNTYMSRQLKYNDGRRLIYGMRFEDVAAEGVMPEEAKLFLQQARESDASASFYETGGRPQIYSSAIVKNQLLEGAKSSSEVAMEIIEKEKQLATCSC